MEYTDIPRVADERTILLSFLVWQRETLARKCAGLSDDQLRLRTAEPSTLSLLGLVRHLADVERGWLQRTLGGHDVPFRFVADDDEDADFNGAATGDVREAFDA